MWNPYQSLTPRTRHVLGLAMVVLVMLIWTALTVTEWVSPTKLPSPMRVGRAFVQLAAWDSSVDASHASHGSQLLSATLWSCARVFLAGVLVVLIGVPLGIAMGSSPRLNAALSPLIDPFRSAPIVALLPILVMWLGISELMKITFLFLGAVVFLVPMVRDAIRAVPQSYWISARDLGANRWEAIWQAVIPMAKPRIADAIITAVSVMWTYITVAEYVNANRGLGKLMQDARRFSAMDQVFVCIFVIIALALVTYSAMQALKRWLYPWETE